MLWLVALVHGSCIIEGEGGEAWREKEREREKMRQRERESHLPASSYFG